MGGHAEAGLWGDRRVLGRVDLWADLRGDLPGVRRGGLLGDLLEDRAEPRLQLSADHEVAALVGEGELTW